MRLAKVQAACAALRSAAPSRAAKAPTPSAPLSSKGLGIVFVSLSQPAGSAASLLEAAADYAWTEEVAKQMDCLNQIVSTYPGTLEAGVALVNLADYYERVNNASLSTQLYDQVRTQYPDPDLQEYATLAQAWCHPLQNDSYDAVIAVSVDAMEHPRGIVSATFGALQLATLYQYNLEDYASAQAIYEAVRDAYPGAPAAREAKLGIAECISWSPPFRHADAMAIFQEVAAEGGEYRHQVRAVFAVGHSLFELGDLEAALGVFAQVIAHYPGTRPADYAQMETALCHERLGQADTAFTEVGDYLSGPHDDPVYLCWAHYLRGALLARNGDLPGAEADFRWVLASPRNELVRTVSSLALAQCLDGKGDRGGALDVVLAAADAAPNPSEKAQSLLSALVRAQEMGSAALASSLFSRLQQECPGDYLVGRAAARLATAGSR